MLKGKQESFWVGDGVKVVQVILLKIVVECLSFLRKVGKVGVEFNKLFVVVIEGQVVVCEQCFNIFKDVWKSVKICFVCSFGVLIEKWLNDKICLLFIGCS